MKVIFLDIDGVLNTEQTFIDIHTEWKVTGNRRIEIDEFRVQFLKRIVEETNAKIVLSSSWKIFYKKENNILIPEFKNAIQLNEILNKYNLEIYDITPRDIYGIRQNEINAWLQMNDNIESFIILDDDSKDLIEFIDNQLIKTNFHKTNKELYTGLCEHHICQAVDILNQKKFVKKLFE